MGSPGVGKGTQAKLLSKFKIKQISTGDAIRNSINPTIIKYREEGYARGDLLSDELIFEILKKEIKNLGNEFDGYVLDGAVRTLKQAKYTKLNNLVDEVIYFNLTKEVATKRLLSRDEGRSDDNIIAIEHRFIEYENKTKPVLEFLKENFIYHEVNAESTIEEINKETIEKLGL